MRQAIILVIAAFLANIAAEAQGVVGDLLAGKLVNPEVGQWAWYDLTAGKGNKKFVIRQAIVGEEKVDRKKGYWVEFEIVPEVGYKMVYKMLLTGPASDPGNIVRVIEKPGPEHAVEVEVKAADPGAGDAPKPVRKSLGMEEVTTLDGPVRAEHFQVTQGDRTMDVWINEKINPTGIVKMHSIDGLMLLRNHGRGGEFARSVITEEPISAEEAAKTREPIPPQEGLQVEAHVGADTESKTE